MRFVRSLAGEPGVDRVWAAASRLDLDESSCIFSSSNAMRRVPDLESRPFHSVTPGHVQIFLSSLSNNARLFSAEVWASRRSSRKVVDHVRVVNDAAACAPLAQLHLRQGNLATMARNPADVLCHCHIGRAHLAQQRVKRAVMAGRRCR